MRNPSLLALLLLSLALPAQAAYRFGSGPLADAKAAAAAGLAANKKVTDLKANELTAMLIAITYDESGAKVTGVPPPMALGRFDLKESLKSFGGTQPKYVRAYFHAGVGMWQLDSAGLGTDVAAPAAVDTARAAPVVVGEVLRRWRSSKATTKAGKRKAAWGAWYACQNGGCETIFDDIYDASKDELVLTEDASVSSKGGMEWHKCAPTGDTKSTFDCALIDPAKAEGSAGGFTFKPWEGNAGVSPLTFPFVSFDRNRTEERHWPRKLTSYDTFVSATRPFGTNARGGLTWAKPQRICTWLKDCTDVALVIDTTGSMWDDLAAVRAGASSLVSKLIEPTDEEGNVSEGVRVSVVDYKDFPSNPYGDPGDYPYLARLPFSNQQESVVGALPTSAGGGNDWPESAMTALTHTLNADGLTPWREGDMVERAIILMTDAPGHDPDPFTGSSTGSVIALAQDVSVQTAAAALAPADGVTLVSTSAASLNATPSPVHIHSVVIGFDWEALAQHTYVSHATGGEIFPAATASEVVDALAEAIGTVTGPPPDDGGGGDPGGNHPPDVSGAVASVTSLWPANHGFTAVDVLNVRDPDGDAVSITITGVTQDEPVQGPGSGATAPDATGVGSSRAQLRAERAGSGSDRVYRVRFVATDSKGAQTEGSVQVCAPHDQGGNTACVDDGQSYDATAP